MGALYLLEQIRTPFFDKLFSVITYLGSEAVVLVLIMAALWCFDKKFGRLVLYSSLFSLGLNILLKNIFCVPRPWVKDPGFTIVEAARSGATGYSFPSGHTANAVTTYGSVFMFYKNKWVRVISAICVVLVAFSRLYLGVHTLEDVLVSLLLGIVILTIVYILYQKSLTSKRVRLILDLSCVVFATGILLWLVLFPARGEIDPELTAEGLKNVYSSFGAIIGFAIAINIDDRFINYRTNAVLWVQILKLAVGGVLVFGIKELLKAPLELLFNGNDFSHSIRYFLMVITGGCLWPMTFKYWEKLGKKKGNELI